MRQRLEGLPDPAEQAQGLPPPTPPSRRWGPAEAPNKKQNLPPAWPLFGSLGSSGDSDSLHLGRMQTVLEATELARRGARAHLLGPPQWRAEPCPQPAGHQGQQEGPCSATQPGQASPDHKE